MFAGYIAYCSQQGIINGYGDGYFRPAGTLTGYAFMKMLLTSLGYSTDAEGFTGPNWTINVAKLTSNLGLDKGNDEFSGAAAVTREEASLYAFNTLQADLVEYEKGNTVIINGQQITSSTDRKAKAIKWLNSSDNDGNIDGTINENGKVVGDGYIQFAEQYFNKLKKIASTDDFARPSTKWTFKGDKIGNYVDTPDASYTSNVKLGQIYTDLNMTQKDKNAEVWINGVQCEDVAVSSNNSLKIASGGNKDMVGDGSIVDVFYDENNNHVKICVVDVYVGTVTNVVTKNVAEPYIIIHNYSDIYTKDNRTTPYTFAKDEDKYETEESFAEDDIVLFTFSQGANAIKDVWTPESVEGTITKIVYDKSVEVDATTTYKYSMNAAFLEGGKDNDETVQTKSEYTVYLDDNGLVIYVAESEFNPDDYAFVLYLEGSSTKWGKDRAKLVTSAGKVITVNTDDDYTTRTGDKKVLGRVVLFRENSNGEYTLRLPANDKDGKQMWGQTGSAKVYGDAAEPMDAVNQAGYKVPIANNTPKGGQDSGVAHSGSTTFLMKNDSAIIHPDTGDSTKDLRANSETVFVTAETDTDGKTTYQAYVGVKNAPSIASDGSDIGLSEAGTKVEAFWATRTNGLLAFMFIDITEANYTNGTKDIVFFAGAKGVSKRTQNSDGKYYYTYNAVVDGEITTIDVLENADFTDATGASPATYVNAAGKTVTCTAGSKDNMVYTDVKYDNNGYVKSVKQVDNNDYSTETGEGIWKLSGKYSVGLGSSKNRETVADSAKIYYVDQDGVITKKDSMSEVYTDRNATYVAVFDKEDGDIEYLFIQEPAHDKEEGAGSVITDTITVEKVSGGVTYKWTAAKAGKTYTAELFRDSAGGGEASCGAGTAVLSGTTLTGAFATSLLEGTVYTIKITEVGTGVVASAMFKG